MPWIATGIIVTMPCPATGKLAPHHLPDLERRPTLVVCVGCAAGKE